MCTLLCVPNADTAAALQTANTLQEPAEKYGEHKEQWITSDTQGTNKHRGTYFTLLKYVLFYSVL